MNKASFGFALIISSILLVAAFGKIVFPPSFLKIFFCGIGFFEIFLGFILLFFHRYFQIWCILASVFALWGGYAMFWAMVGLPCACFGKIMEISPKISLLLDLIFFTLSLYMAYYLGLSPSKGRLLVVLSIFFAMVGFLAGYAINNFIIVEY